MPVPDFSPGEVLTAAAMDSIGMWRVGGGPLSGAITNFAGCFSSTYDMYRITIDSVAANGVTDMYIQYLTTGTTVVTGNNYFWMYRGLTGSAASQDTGTNSNAAGYLGWTTPGAGGQGGVIFDVVNPNRAFSTFTVGQAFYLSSGTYGARQGSTAWDTNATFTGFRINTLTAATLTGNVNIYGYRKP
jgi:hypothetical protein